jgi:hypothetical protein
LSIILFRFPSCWRGFRGRSGNAQANEFRLHARGKGLRRQVGVQVHVQHAEGQGRIAQDAGGGSHPLHLPGRYGALIHDVHAHQ